MVLKLLGTKMPPLGTKSRSEMTLGQGESGLAHREFQEYGGAFCRRLRHNPVLMMSPTPDVVVLMKETVLACPNCLFMVERGYIKLTHVCQKLNTFCRKEC